MPPDLGTLPFRGWLEFGDDNASRVDPIKHAVNQFKKETGRVGVMFFKRDPMGDPMVLAVEVELRVDSDLPGRSRGLTARL